MKFSYHFEILCAAFRSSVVTGQQHFFDVVTRAVVELAHVKGPGLEAGEVRPFLQSLEDAVLHQVCVPDLIPEQNTTQHTYRI